MGFNSGFKGLIMKIAALKKLPGFHTGGVFYRKVVLCADKFMFA